MSVLLTKCLWYPLKNRNNEELGDNQYDNPINITDSVMVSVGKGLDIKNNILVLNLRNAHSLYVNTYNQIEFEEQDMVEFYAKYTDDGADVTSTEWNLTNSTVPVGTQYHLGTYYVIEFAVQHTQNSTLINLKTADKTYVLFNKVLAKAFTKTDAKSAPEIIQNIIRLSCQQGKNPSGFIGSGSDPNVKYDVDARLDSERTSAEVAAGIHLITDTRRNIREDGTTNPTLEFPEIEFAKVWKPIYEWIQELSQIEKTNSVSELSGTTALVYGRPFIFWVDEENRFHWVYPTDDINDYIEVGKFDGETLSFDATKTNDADVYDINMVKRVFDVTNMIIYNCGDDMYKTGIWNYKVNTTSRVKTLKMRVVPMIDIAEKWKNLDYNSEYCPEASRKGTPAGSPKYQFPADAVYIEYNAGTKACAFPPTDTYSISADIDNDSEYNAALRERCQKEGEVRAEALLAGLSQARWKGSITVKGKAFTVGSLIELTDSSQGIYREKLRIMDLKHNFSTNSWTTQLTLEQDPEAVEVNL